MLRKTLTATAITFLGLFAMSGVATADTYDEDGTITVAITDADGIVDPAEVFVFLGDGFDANEGIGVVDTFTGPSGLRSTKSFTLAARSGSYTDQADGGGHFDIPLNLGEEGYHTLSATGLSSGKSGSLQVLAVAGSTTGGGTSGGSGGSTNTGGGSNSGTGSGNGLAYTGAGSDSSSGLAYTGTSLAGPIAIGAVALLAGLALLFFGTRGVIRRKNATASTEG